MKFGQFMPLQKKKIPQIILQNVAWKLAPGSFVFAKN